MNFGKLVFSFVALLVLAFVFVAVGHIGPEEPTYTTMDLRVAAAEGVPLGQARTDGESMQARRDSLCATGRIRCTY